MGGVPTTPKALSTLTVPTMVVAAEGDTSTDPKALKAAVAKSPAKRKAFVAGRDGLHGVGLLTKAPDEVELSQIGTQVARFVRTGALP